MNDRSLYSTTIVSQVSYVYLLKVMFTVQTWKPQLVEPYSCKKA